MQFVLSSLQKLRYLDMQEENKEISHTTVAYVRHDTRLSYLQLISTCLALSEQT